MKKETIEILEKPFDKKDIKQRAGSFGRTLDYVSNEKVISRLNKAFNLSWSFKVLTSPKDMIVGDSVIAHVEITAPNDDCPGCFIVKQAVGGKKITMKRGTTEWLDIASDMKACVTDALKKAATLLGVALDLYGTDDEPVAQSTDAKIKTEDDGPASEAQKNAIKTIAQAKGKKLEDVLKAHNVTSLNDLKLSQAKVIITSLNSSK